MWLKALAIVLVLIAGVSGVSQARVRYINPYIRSDGTYVAGHYRDVSNDGYEYNNANYLGYNADHDNRYNPYTGW